MASVAPGPADKGRILLPLAIVVAATVLLGAVSLLYPHGRDQGYHAFLADAMLHGRVLYRDFLMYVLPMTVMVHAGALVLFGHSMTAIRIADLLWTIATAGAIFLFVRRAFDRPWIASAAGVAYSFLYYLFDYWHTAQNDGFSNLPVAAAFALVAGPADRPRRLRWVIAGICAGAALLFKYTVILVLPALGVALWVSTANNGPRVSWWRAAAWLAAGCSLTLAVCLLVILFSGALPGFVEGELQVLAPYSQVVASGVLQRTHRMMTTYLAHHDHRLGAALGVLGLVLAVVSFIVRWPEAAVRRWWRPFTLVLLWAGAASFSTFIQGKFFFYHYLPMLPVLAILTALGLGFVLGRPWPLLRRSVLRVLVFAVALGAVLPFTAYARRYRDLFGVTIGRSSLRDHWASDRYTFNVFSLRDQLKVVEYLERRTGPSDAVFVWGYDPLINFLARRAAVSRFVPPIQAADWAGVKYRTELVQVLDTSPPAMFIVEHGDRSRHTRGHDLDSYESLLRFEELRDLVAEHYELEAQIGRFDLLRHAQTEQAR